MDYIIQFQLNIFALSVIICLYVIMQLKSKIKPFSRTLLKITLSATAIALIVEPLTWIFDQKMFFGAYALEYATNFILLLLSPIICGLMLSYVDYYLHRDRDRLIKRWYYMYFLFFNVFVLILNFFFPIYFVIERTTNTYSVGPFQFVNIIIISLHYIYLLYMIFSHKNKTSTYALTIFSIFVCLPIIGMFVQLINVNIFLSWSSITLALLFVYIFLETSNGEVDYLTSLYNRRSFETYVYTLIEKEKKFKIIYIDINDFKGINDQLGHHTGDLVLLEFSKILKKSFYPNMMIARLGGDEFMVIDEYDLHVSEIIKHIKEKIKVSKMESLNTLTFSHGVKTFKKGMTLDQLYISVDKNMYAEKRKYKSNRTNP